MSKDSFEKINVGSIKKSTMIPKELYKNIVSSKKDSVKQSLEIQFGFNRKQDNQIKTKQGRLFGL